MKRKRLLCIGMSMALLLSGAPLPAVQAREAVAEQEIVPKQEETKGNKTKELEIEKFAEEEEAAAGQQESKESEEEILEESAQDMTLQEGSVKAENNPAEGYTYSGLEDGTVEITGYKGSDTELVIPAELDGKAVTSIEGSEFSWSSSLTSITIPGSVTNIGSSVFNGCWRLLQIEVDNNNSKYTSANGILYNKDQTELLRCPKGKKESVEIPGSVTSIGRYAFYGCSGLTDITIPEGVMSIGSLAFELCSSLTSITLPGSIMSIGYEAFSGCSNLTSIIISEGVTNINAWMFSGCSNLTSITLPRSATNISGDAFDGCEKLVQIIVDNNNLNYTSEDGILYNKDKAELLRYPRKKEGNTNIPGSVTSIGDHAFYRCSMTNITIPGSVVSIGEEAFYWCSNLTDVTIQEGVANIGDYAFNNCDGLTNITIPGSVTNIGENAFINCSKLVQIAVDNNNPTYASEDGILYNKDKTELLFCPKGKEGSITIPGSVTSIGRDVFSYGNNLTGITIPGSVTDINDDAFNGCEKLVRITVENNNPTYASEDGILYNKDKTELLRCPKGKGESVEIPGSVTSIGESAFYECRGLTGIIIPEGVTSIGNAAFDSCSGLTNITIPGSVTSIGYSVFASCRSLEKVVLPDTVTQIGDYAFYWDDALKEINVPKNLEKIGKYAFYDCPLKEIVIPESLKKIDRYAFHYSDLESVVFSGKNNLTYVGTEAFYGTVWLKNQTGDFQELNGFLLGYQGTAPKPIIPDSIRSIGEYSFLGKADIAEMTIPKSVSDIAYCAFESCTALENIVLEDGVKSIGESAFINCNNVKSITIPKSVTKIEDRAFGYEYKENEDTWKFEFNKTSSLPTVQCYKNSEAYRYAVKNEIPYQLLDKPHDHIYETTAVTKATTTKNGTITKKCSICDEIKKTAIYYPKTITLAKTAYTYNGKAQKPSVTIKDSKGKTITSSNYTVTYSSGRKNVGTYTVTIKFKNNYTGTVKKTFTIQPKGTSLTGISAKSKGFTVKWKKQSTQTTGYEIQYSTDGKFKKGNKIQDVKKNQTTSQTIKKLKAKKKYYVRIRTYKTVKVSGKSKKIYSDWSKVKSVTAKK